MREYEMICILRPDCSDEIVERVFGKMNRVFEERGGVLLAREAWGKKKLGYEMQKNAKGLFFHFRYLGAGELNAELLRVLRLDDAVLRYMPIKLADKVDAEARVREFQEKELAADAAASDGEAH